MIPLVLVGAAGRMGRAIEQALADAGDLAIKARVERRDRWPADSTGWSDDAAAVLAAGDVAVDFSSPEACVPLAGVCAERGAALVTGTTGLDAAGEEALRAAAARVPLLRAANFSLGMAVLRRALAAALGALPAGWDVEIVERHHRMKTDSPSGTALALAADAARARRQGAVRPRAGPHRPAPGRGDRRARHPRRHLGGRPHRAARGRG